VHVEADFLGVRGPVLVAEAVGVFAVLSRFEGVVGGADGALVEFLDARGVFDLLIPDITHQRCVFGVRRRCPSSSPVSHARPLFYFHTAKAAATTYPELNIQITASPKLPVSDLERDRHLVVLVQCFVETLARMRLHLDVVRIPDREEGGEGEEEVEERSHGSDDTAIGPERSALDVCRRMYFWMWCRRWIAGQTVTRMRKVSAWRLGVES